MPSALSTWWSLCRIGRKRGHQAGRDEWSRFAPSWSHAAFSLLGVLDNWPAIKQVTCRHSGCEWFLLFPFLVHLVRYPLRFLPQDSHSPQVCSGTETLRYVGPHITDVNVCVRANVPSATCESPGESAKGELLDFCCPFSGSYCKGSNSNCLRLAAVF
ncbi:hypothetical protein HYDPIDRAFT_107195 [Hydnomerulius pinastri MD-312]|nr:hypothetical protein HYDPIDRAFT_107195 [Hydnomerulius pinastri MD-312]